MPATLSLIALTAFAAPSFPVQADFVYNGVNRPFMVQVDGVRGAKKLTLRLVKPADGKVVEEVEVKRGKVDVSKAFKTFWSKPHTEVLYLQRAGDGKPNGPALVLQPMVWLRYAECLSALQDIQGSVAAYENVVKVVPNHFAACVSLSALYQQLGRPDDAVKVLLLQTIDYCKSFSSLVVRP